jgi:acetyl-CoA carboxylase biotin carboxyl carrier protein
MSKRAREDTQRIEELSALMERHDLDEVKLRVGETLYEIVRRPPAPPAPAVYALPVEPASPNGSSAPPASGPPANVKRVTAPLVGVFYTAPAPGADPFVTVGDRVAVGQVLCIVEAMKLMNEITSDYGGIIKRILPANGDLVALGEELFWIEP